MMLIYQERRLRQYRKTRFILQFLLLLCACLCPVIVDATSEPPVIALPDNTPEKVVIVHSTGSAPFHFVDEEGHSVGMLIDLWRLWSQKTGIKIEFIPKPWGDTLKMMQEGKADIHAGLFYSAKRDTFLDYSSALHASDTHFFFHKSIFEITDIEDLIPFRIGLIAGDKAIDFISKKLPGATLVVYPSNTTLFDAIEEGEIRVFVKDTPIALYHLSQRGLLHEFRYLVEQPMYSNMFYAGAREGDKALQNIIDQGMTAISPKERSAIVRKWVVSSDQKDENILSVAIASNYMPFSSFGLGGEPIGMMVDIWKLWSRKTGRAIEFRIDDWESTLSLLRKGHVDIHSGLFSSPERKEWLDFSQPFYVVDSSILYHGEDVAPYDQDDFDGKLIGVVGGSYQADYIRQSFPEVDMRTYRGTEAMVMAMLEDEIEYILGERPSIEFLAEKVGRHKEFRWFSYNLFTKKIHAGVKKGNQELLSLVDEGLNAITNQELAAIEKRWIEDTNLRKYSAISPNLRLTQAEESWIAEHKNIRIRGDSDIPPFDFLDKDGTHSGLAASYADLLGKRLGITMMARQAEKISEERAKTDREEFDVIACLVSTTDRQKRFNFTRPYLSFPMVIVTNDKSPIMAGLDELRNKKITVIKDSYATEVLSQNHPGLSLLLVDNVEQGLLAISKNKAHAFVGNLAMISYVSKRLGLVNLKITGTTQYTYDFSFAVRKDWPLLTSILDKALLSISEEEKNTISDSWVSMQFEHKTDWRRVLYWILAVAGVAGIILAFIITWNRRLAKEIIERKKMEEALILDEERLESLLKLSQSTAIHEDEIVEYALEECVRLTKSQVGFIHYIYEDQDTATLYTWSKGTEKYCRAEKTPHYSLKEAGVWADCVRIGKSTIYNDFQGLLTKKHLPEGHVKLLRYMSVPIYDEDKIIMVVGVANKEEPYSDSDDRQISLFMQNTWRIVTAHRVEEKLQFTQYAMDESSDDVFWIEQNGAICYANDAACQNLGYLNEELDTMTIFDIDPDFTKESWGAHWLKVKMFGSLTAEKVHKAENGKIFPVEITVKFMKFGSREILCTFARNISDRKKTEEDMLRNMAELERFSNMATGREKQMIKLKNEINALLREQGRDERYKIVQ